MCNLEKIETQLAHRLHPKLLNEYNYVPYVFYVVKEKNRSYC